MAVGVMARRRRQGRNDGMMQLSLRAWCYMAEPFGLTCCEANGQSQEVERLTKCPRHCRVGLPYCAYCLRQRALPEAATPIL